MNGGGASQCKASLAWHCLQANQLGFSLVLSVVACGLSTKGSAYSKVRNTLHLALIEPEIEQHFYSDCVRPYKHLYNGH